MSTATSEVDRARAVPEFADEALRWSRVGLRRPLAAMPKAESPGTED